MGISVPSWRRQWPVAYGAAELKRFYRRYVVQSLLLSLFLNLFLVSFYWAWIWFHPEARPASTIRIVAYDEFVIPSTETRALGLGAYPVLPVAEDNAFDPSKAQPIPKPLGTQTRRIALPPKDFTRNIGELPSALPAERNDFSGGTQDISPDRQSRLPGGGSVSTTDGTTDGIPTPSRRGESYGGGAHSGVGSSSKPIPGGSSPISGEPFGVEDGSRAGRGYSMLWLQGGTRKKISGEIPKYPAGVNVSAELVFFAIIDPAGEIKAISPQQKGDTRLESAVLNELRFWKFEPLPSTFPQVEQTCVLTFQFKLK